MGAGFNWPEEALARLKVLFVQGKSDHVIAGLLSEEFNTAVSRNAIIGKRHRLKLGNVVKKMQQPVPRIPPRRLAGCASNSMVKRIRAVAKVIAVHPGLPVATGFKCMPVTLNELEDKMCKWPVGGLYCGDKALWRRPYCAGHARESAR